VAALGINGFLRELASHTAFESERDGTLSLVLHESFANLYTKEREAELKRALEQHYGRTLRLNVRVGQPDAETPAQERTRERGERQDAAEQSIRRDPAVGALMEKFNARVVPGTVRPKT